jgi:hypothetical protein
MNPPTLPPHRLPIWPTVHETFTTALRYSGYLARIGWLWCLLAVGLGLLLSWQFGRIAEPVVETTVWSTLVFDTLQSAIRGFCLAAIAVPWHRHFLAAGAAQPIQWWRTVMLYGLIATAIEFIVAVGLLPAFAPPYDTLSWFAIFLVVTVAAVYATTRLAFVLPALALGRDSTCAGAWLHTRGNGWQLVLINLIVFLTALFPFFFITWGLFESGYASTILTEFVMFLTYLLGIIALSIAYRELVLKPPAFNDKSVS